LTVEEKDDDLYDVSDLLEPSGKISKKRTNELIQHINETRGEWDHE
jgi:hypothetical protein